jgi:peptide/nickel transport system ATP-binding protein
MTPVLALEQVSHRYRGAATATVADVSLAIAPGETLGLVGPSGSGKSTLARLVMALERPASGRVLLEGTDLATVKPATLRRLRQRWSMVFQEPGAAFNPRSTAGEAVAVPLRVHALCPRHERGERVRALLDRVQLDPALAARPIHALSGGQKQRLALARALATGPALIVLDEAVSALDTVVRGGILRLLVDLQRRDGLAMLFISHDLAVVRTVSHRIAVMEAGRIVETGPADAVIAAPRSAIAQALVAAVPRLPEGGPHREPA